jgi:hypothetical protein
LVAAAAIAPPYTASLTAATITISSTTLAIATATVAVAASTVAITTSTISVTSPTISIATIPVAASAVATCAAATPVTSPSRYPVTAVAATEANHGCRDRDVWVHQLGPSACIRRDDLRKELDFVPDALHERLVRDQWLWRTGLLYLV